MCFCRHSFSTPPPPFHLFYSLSRLVAWWTVCGQIVAENAVSGRVSSCDVSFEGPCGLLLHLPNSSDKVKQQRTCDFYLPTHETRGHCSPEWKLSQNLSGNRHLPTYVPIIRDREVGPYPLFRIRFFPSSKRCMNSLAFGLDREVHYNLALGPLAVAPVTVAYNIRWE